MARSASLPWGHTLATALAAFVAMPEAIACNREASPPESADGDSGDATGGSADDDGSGSGNGSGDGDPGKDDDTGSTGGDTDATGSDDATGGHDATGSDDSDGDSGPGDVDGDGITIVGYFAQWGVYDRDYQVWDIPERVDVVNYAFWDVQDDGTLRSPDEFADLERRNCSDALDPLCDGGSYPNSPDPGLPYYGNLRALNRLQEVRGIKVLLSLGGWTLSTNFSGVAADPAKREAFAQSCKQVIETYGLDGIDLDWEFPVEGGNDTPHSPEDRRNFTLLVQTLREVVGPDVIITAAVSPNPDHVANLEPEALSQLLDWINLMAYDYAGSWDSITGHNAPLHETAGDMGHNVENLVVQWKDAGFPTGHMMLGIPFYGRSWSGVSCQDRGDLTSGLGCEASGVGPGTWEPGVLDYQDVDDDYVGASGWVRTWDPSSQVPTLYNAAAAQFITYDDTESVAAKAELATDHGLGGLMIWELSGDRSGDLLEVMSW